MHNFYLSFLEKSTRAHLKRELPPLHHPPLGEEGIIYEQGKPLLNLSSNDYLGLSRHPHLLEEGLIAARRLGGGLPSSRLVCGNEALYTSLEERLATWLGRESALIFPTGYQANISLMQSLLDSTVIGKDAVVFFDKYNHASLYTGAGSTKTPLVRYKHLDYAHLEAQICRYAPSPNQPKVIVSETLFSMDGDCASLPLLEGIAQKYGALLVLDDAHGVGVYGPHGQGLSAAASPETLIMGTFSKAFGVMGGFVAGPQWLKSYLLQKGGGLIYSTALPPFVLGALHGALNLMENLQEEREHLLQRAHQFRTLAAQKGLRIMGNSHILPLFMGECSTALHMVAVLKEEGFFTTAIRPPTVPPHTARLRLCLHPAHPWEHLERFLEVVRHKIPEFTN